MVNLQDTPSAGPLILADLKAARQINPGRIYLATHRATLMTDPTEAPELLWRGQFPDTIPTDFGSGYGDLRPVRQPRVVPCSTLARLALAAKDGNPRGALAIVIGVAALALLAAGASVAWWLAEH